MSHTVWRHGGSSNHRWRRVFSGTLDQCAGKYLFARAALRQGAVMVLPSELDAAEWPQVLTNDHVVQVAWKHWALDKEPMLLHAWAPRLRTRW